MEHSFLKDLVKNWEKETQWLDMLSQLEYIGFRKIVKAVRFENVDHEVLRHAQEESLHSYLLKNIVSERAPKFKTWNNNPWCEWGWRYFQQVDQEVSHRVDGDPYPVVSQTIEQRVLRLYPEYLEVAIDGKVRRALSVILAQEKRHETLFEPAPNWAVEIETHYWDELAAKIESHLDEISPPSEIAPSSLASFPA